MQEYKIDIVLTDEQEKRLEKLERKFKKINGWNKEQILQFAFSALQKNTEVALLFLELKADFF